MHRNSIVVSTVSRFVEQTWTSAVRAASRAILAGAMWIHLDSDCALNIGLVFGVAVDLAVKLIGLAAVHLPRFACAFGLDLPQPLKCNTQPGYLVQTLAMMRETDVERLLRSFVAHAPKSADCCAHSSPACPTATVFSQYA